MKTLIKIIIFLIFTVTYSQEYFIERYDLMITETNERFSSEVYIEYNAFNSTDIILHIQDFTPVRFIQETEVQVKNDEELTYQEVYVRESSSNTLYKIKLYNGGAVYLHNLKNNQKVLLVKTDKDI